jgi:hypothetical protein
MSGKSFARPGRDPSPQFIEETQPAGCAADALPLPPTPFRGRVPPIGQFDESAANRRLDGKLRVAVNLRRTSCRTICACSPWAFVRGEIAARFLRQRFENCDGIATRGLLSPSEQTPAAQPDDALSVLRLNYETLKGLISLPSATVAQPTLCGTSCEWLSIGSK